jgi:hypothetical protein
MSCSLSISSISAEIMLIFSMISFLTRAKKEIIENVKDSGDSRRLYNCKRMMIKAANRTRSNTTKDNLGC